METNGGAHSDLPTPDRDIDPEAQLALIAEAEGAYFNPVAGGWKTNLGLEGPWTIGQRLALWGLTLTIVGCGVFSIWRMTRPGIEGLDWVLIAVLAVLFPAAFALDRVRGMAIGARPHAVPPVGAWGVTLRAAVPVLIGLACTLPLVVIAAEAGSFPLALGLFFLAIAATIALNMWWSPRFGPGARTR